MRTQWVLINLCGGAAICTFSPVAEPPKFAQRRPISTTHYQRIDDVPDNINGQAVADLVGGTCDIRRMGDLSRLDDPPAPLRYDQLGIGRIVSA